VSKLIKGKVFVFFLREKKKKDDDGIFLWEEILTNQKIYTHI
jgi:hypothetical protein